MIKTYILAIWDSIHSALVGMKITIEHLFYKNVTHQYPNVDARVSSGTAAMPSYARNRIDFIPEACTACNLCEKACPVNCIEIESIKVVEGDTDQPMMKNGKPRKQWISKYNIDFTKCCYCGLCVNACTFDALKMTDFFEYATYDRKDLYYHLSEMTPEMVNNKKQMLENNTLKIKAEKAQLAHDTSI